MATLTLRVPDKDTKGYLGRVFEYAEIMDAFDAGSKAAKAAVAKGEKPDPMAFVAVLRRVMEFLLPMVEVDDGADPRAALYGLSENELWGLFKASSGGVPAVPKGSETASSEPSPASP